MIPVEITSDAHMDSRCTSPDIRRVIAIEQAVKLHNLIAATPGIQMVEVKRHLQLSWQSFGLPNIFNVLRHRLDTLQNANWLFYVPKGRTDLWFPTVKGVGITMWFGPHIVGLIRSRHGE